MNSQGPSQLRGYPDPSASDQLVNATTYFHTQPTQQASLSHEDQNLANSLSNANQLSSSMNGHLGALPPQLNTEHTPNFQVGGQSALPHTPHQSQMSAPITGPHAGVEPNQDLSYNTGSNSRKRSKISRACDECRKTKIRCDAATSTSDGSVVQKCTNCTRKNLDCQFSRAPLKRGPSKGYIKELAERVQQVESHVGIPGAGFRQSIDAAGSPPDAYPDQQSPEESLSGSRKRNHSQFESNVFSQSPHQRTSLGGYSLGQSAHRQSRTRDSIALAPDQKITDIPPQVPLTELNTSGMALPFWRDLAGTTFTTTAGADQSVREATLPVGDDWNEDDLFKNYLDNVHNELSILPKSYENVRYYVSQCSAKQAAALTYVMARACVVEVPDDVFSTELKFEDYVWAKARGLPLTRGKAQNIVWLWILTFMLLNADCELGRLVGWSDLLPKAMIADLAIYLVQQIKPSTELTSTAQIDAGFETEYDTVSRTYFCMAVLVRLFNIGSGDEDQLKATDVIFRKLVKTQDLLALMTPKTAFLSSLSKTFSLLANLGPRGYERMPDSELIEPFNDAVMEGLDAACLQFPSSIVSSGFTKKVQLFLTLLLVRKNVEFDPAGIRIMAQELADELSQDTVGLEPAPLVKPLEVHLYVVAAYTLLEIMDNDYRTAEAAAQKALAKLITPLEDMRDRARFQLMKEQVQLETESPVHWSQALLSQIIERVQPRSTLAQSEGIGEGSEIDAVARTMDQDPGTNGNTETPLRKTFLVSLQQYRTLANNLPTLDSPFAMHEGKKYKVFNFALLTQHGYLKVLGRNYTG